MKKLLCIIFVLSFLLAGCNTVEPEQTEMSDSAASETQEELTTAAQTKEEQSFEIQMPAGEVGITMPEIGLGQDVPESDISLGDAGRIRLEYKGNRNSVRYITDVSGVSGYPELSEYDEAYFEKNALLLVIVTMTSSSVQTEIGAVEVKDNTASVYVSRTMEGEVGTTDMATWLMWSEVEAGLEYEWTLGNVNMDNNVSEY